MARVLLMVGTQKGAFLISSNDRRNAWDLVGPLLKGWSVFDLMMDSRNGRSMYGAVGHFVYGPAIHRSDDLGKSWVQIENPPKYAPESPFKMNNIWCIVPGRTSQPNVLYAGTDEAGLFISRNAGETWDEVSGLTSHPSRNEWAPGNGGLCLHSIALDPTDEDRMWVGISAVGVFRTDDGGASWRSANSGLDIIIPGETHKDIGTCVHHMIVDPHNPERLFQQNHYGVFRSLNGGDSWERIENGIPNRFGFPMVMLPDDSNTVFIVPQESDEFRLAKNGHLTVYRTTNGGNSWEPLRSGLPDQAYVGVLRQAMAVDTCESPGVYFGTNNGQIFYSRNSGEHWETMPYAFPRIQSLNVAVID